MRYTWVYGIIHWFIHYSLTILLVMFSGIIIFPIFVPFTLFGMFMKGNIVDMFVVSAVSSLVDLDHLPALRLFGRKKYIHTEKRFVYPVHNFFFLATFAIASAFSSLFISKIMGVLFFSIVLHLLWDIVEDVLVFKTSFRKWEQTWGLNKEAMKALYNEIFKSEEPLSGKKSDDTD